MKKLITVIVLFITITTYCQNETYESDQFIIKYPSTWTLNTSGMRGTKLVLSSPVSSNNGAFYANVNVLTQNLAGMNLDLDKYVTLSKSQFSSLPKAKINSSKRIKQNGIEYHELTVDAHLNNLDLSFLQHYYIVDDLAYVITYTQTQSDNEENFNEGKEILKSFKIKQ